MGKPRSKNTGRFRQKSTGNRWNTEAVFLPDFFRSFSTSSYQKAQEIDWNPSEKIQQIFRRSTASLKAIFDAFLQDPVGAVGRNLRPGKSAIFGIVIVSESALIFLG
jgi:hypothetical protein